MSKAVIITDRDKKLFQYLFANKVATNDQIRLDVFNNASKQVVHRRLDKLINAKFLCATYLRTKGNRIIYSLAKKALNKYIGAIFEASNRQLKSECIYHDLMLVDLQRTLLKLSCVNKLYTENLISSDFYDENEVIHSVKGLNADAIISLNVDNSELYFALEYERSRKASKRYETIIKKYYANNLIDAVLFVSKNSSIQKQVMAKEKKFLSGKEPKFFYILEKEITKLGLEKINFININQEVFTMS